MSDQPNQPTKATQSLGFLILLKVGIQMSLMCLKQKATRISLNNSLKSPNSAGKLEDKRGKAEKLSTRDPQPLYRRSLSCSNSLQLSWRLQPISTWKPEPSACYCSGGDCGLKVMVKLGAVSVCLMSLQLC